VADDIDMWNDLQTMDGRTSEAKVLTSCYYFKYVENDNETAEKYKDVFETTFGYWGNYY